MAPVFGGDEDLTLPKHSRQLTFFNPDVGIQKAVDVGIQKVHRSRRNLLALATQAEALDAVESYPTQRILKVVLQKSTPPQIRQLILCYY